MSNTTGRASLIRFNRPYDWNVVDKLIHTQGGAILEDFIGEEFVNKLNAEFDTCLATTSPIAPDSGSSEFDEFLGYKTLRVQNLLNVIASGGELIGNEELVSWSNRSAATVSTSCILNSAELIQINPGEKPQRLHRDTNQWPEIMTNEYPLLNNAIIALDPFTEENGATRVVPGSAQWDRGREPCEDELVRATMKPGDALLIRGDTLHGGGANHSGKRRRAISVSYCLGWLRPIENNLLNVNLEQAATLSPVLQQILGFGLYDGGELGNSILGVFGNYSKPSKALKADV